MSVHRIRLAGPWEFKWLQSLGPGRPEQASGSIKIPSDWQDEVSIFLLVGATFLSAGWVQQWRGHVGINALSAVLPAGVDRMRRFVSDIATLIFCVFFGWKCWTLLIEAVKDGQISGSAFGAPLWIPYGCMAVSMTLLVFVLLEQVLSRDSLRADGA